VLAAAKISLNKLNNKHFQPIFFQKYHVANILSCAILDINI